MYSSGDVSSSLVPGSRGPGPPEPRFVVVAGVLPVAEVCAELNTSALACRAEFCRQFGAVLPWQPLGALPWPQST